MQLFSSNLEIPGGDAPANYSRQRHAQGSAGAEMAADGKISDETYLKPVDAIFLIWKHSGLPLSVGCNETDVHTCCSF